MKRKKIFWGILTACLLLGLCACNNTSSDETEVIYYDTNGSEITYTDDNVYSLEEYDAQDLIDFVYSCADISTDNSYSAYPDRFPVTPLTNPWDNEITGRTYEWSFDYSHSNNIIGVVALSDIYLDGDTIKADVDGRVTVSFESDDVELITEVYDTLFEYLKDKLSDRDLIIYDNRPITDDGSIGGWSSSIGDYEFMVLGTDNYYVSVSIPLITE